jgi:hypothetical protein
MTVVVGLRVMLNNIVTCGPIGSYVFSIHGMYALNQKLKDVGSPLHVVFIVSDICPRSYTHVKYIMGFIPKPFTCSVVPEPNLTREDWARVNVGKYPAVAYDARVFTKVTDARALDSRKL